MNEYRVREKCDIIEKIQIYDISRLYPRALNTFFLKFYRPSSVDFSQNYILNRLFKQPGTLTIKWQ
jgi:hypothetical protein